MYALVTEKDKAFKVVLLSTDSKVKTIIDNITDVDKYSMQRICFDTEIIELKEKLNQALFDLRFYVLNDSSILLTESQREKINNAIETGDKLVHALNA